MSEKRSDLTCSILLKKRLRGCRNKGSKPLLRSITFSSIFRLKTYYNDSHFPHAKKFSNFTLNFEFSSFLFFKCRFYGGDFQSSSLGTLLRPKEGQWVYTKLVPEIFKSRHFPAPCVGAFCTSNNFLHQLPFGGQTTYRSTEILPETKKTKQKISMWLNTNFTRIQI